MVLADDLNLVFHDALLWKMVHARNTPAATANEAREIDKSVRLPIMRPVLSWSCKRKSLFGPCPGASCRRHQCGPRISRRGERDKPGPSCRLPAGKCRPGAEVRHDESCGSPSRIPLTLRLMGGGRGGEGVAIKDKRTNGSTYVSPAPFTAAFALPWAGD